MKTSENRGMKWKCWPEMTSPFNDQCSHYVETRQLICRANQLTGFYMMETLAVKRLRDTILEGKLPY